MRAVIPCNPRIVGNGIQKTPSCSAPNLAEPTGTSAGNAPWWKRMFPSFAGPRDRTERALRWHSRVRRSFSRCRGSIYKALMRSPPWRQKSLPKALASRQSNVLGAGSFSQRRHRGQVWQRKPIHNCGRCSGEFPTDSSNGRMIHFLPGIRQKLCCRDSFALFNETKVLYRHLY